MRASVLVVDDERGFRVLATEALEDKGHEVRSAPSLARAREELAHGAPDVVLLDRRLPDGDGLSLLPALQGGPQVIVVTAYGDVASAVTALRSGATDYLTKPILAADLVARVDAALTTRGLRDRLALALRSENRPPLRTLPSPAERRLRGELEALAASPSTPVLLLGASGSGKQCAAEVLHHLTFGPDAPFVEVNCPAIPRDLFESELFGHEPGAFTDARGGRRGLVEVADGGTLFLDEVGDLPEAGQAKLLKFLDTMRYRRIGGDREREVRLRVVAATNQALAARVAEGAFRADLYHRLSVFTVTVPSLRDRPEDVLPLAEDFLAFFAGRIKKRLLGFSEDARRRLRERDYPGNVRELRNLVERAAIVARGEQVEADDLLMGPPRPADLADALLVVREGADGPPALEEVELAYVRSVLERCGGRRTEAAERLGVSYPTLLRKLRAAGLDDG